MGSFLPWRITVGIFKPLRGSDISVCTNSFSSFTAFSSEGSLSPHMDSPQTVFLNSFNFLSKFSSSSLKKLSMYCSFQAFPKWGVAPIKTNPLGGFFKLARTATVAPKDQPTTKASLSIFSATFWVSLFRLSSSRWW